MQYYNNLFVRFVNESLASDSTFGPEWEGSLYSRNQDAEDNTAQLYQAVYLFSYDATYNFGVNVFTHYTQITSMMKKELIGVSYHKMMH
jgi:hypothetical protein